MCVCVCELMGHKIIPTYYVFLSSSNIIIMLLCRTERRGYYVGTRHNHTITHLHGFVCNHITTITLQ